MSDTLRAALWMTGAISAFISMALAGRAVSLDHDTFEILLFRSIFGLILVLILARLLRTSAEIRAEQLPLHLARNICHFTGQNLWFYALTVLPLAQVFALEFTMPLWVALLAPVMLGEKLTPRGVVYVLIGFLGILIVTRPDFRDLDPNILLAASAAIGFAGSAIFTKRLLRRQTVTGILFWMTVMQIGLGVVCAGLDGDIRLPRGDAWLWLAVIGAAGVVAHFCLTTALKYAPATTVLPIDFTRLPLIALIGALFYEEPLEWAVFIGALFIFASNYMNIRQNRA